MSLNLHLLRLFVAVARHRSFSRAADALHLSQPAVSKGVREFEAQVGSRLLERGGPGGIALTEAGALLLRHATSLFTAERAAEEELAALRGLHRGTLSVGASTTVATYHLPPLLGLFHQRHPAIDLRLTSANTRAIADLLTARELDIALAEGPVDEPGIEVLAWRQETMVLIAAPVHWLAGMTAPLTPEVLSDAIFIVREPGSGTRDVVLGALGGLRIAPRRMLEVGSTEAIKQIVAGGLGVAMVSAAAAADQLALGRLVVLEVAGLGVRRTLSRLSLPARQPSAAAAAFNMLLDGHATAVA